MTRTTIAVLVCVLTVFSTSHGETLPTTGTFRGIYHKDRFGVARFKFFVVHPSLFPKLDKYEGKYIEVEVTKGSQPMNPGPSVMLAVGKVRELQQPPVRITIQTLASSIRQSEHFQILVNVQNTGRTPIQFRPNNMLVALNMSQKSADTRKDFVTGAYARDKFAQRAGRWQLRSVAKSEPWRRHHILGHPSDHVGRVQLGEQQTFPFVVLLEKGVGKGKYEIEARLTLEGKKKLIPVAGWHAFDFPPARNVAGRGASALRLSASQFRTENEWTSCQLVVKNSGADARFLPQCADSGNVRLWLGRLRGYSRKGDEIPLTFDWPDQHSKGPPSKPWTMTEIAPEGLVSRLAFRPESYFPKQPIENIECDLLTDRGIESFVLTRNFTDKAFVVPPGFGPAARGVRCRIRTHKGVYRQGERIRVFWQVENLDQKPITMVSKDGGWLVKVDGARVAKPYNASAVWGWATPRGPYAPDEFWLELDSAQLKPGKHVIQLACKGTGGWYKNVNGKNIAILKGALTSNDYELTIQKTPTSR